MSKRSNLSERTVGEHVTTRKSTGGQKRRATEPRRVSRRSRTRTTTTMNEIALSVPVGEIKKPKVPYEQTEEEIDDVKELGDTTSPSIITNEGEEGEERERKGEGEGEGEGEERKREIEGKEHNEENGMNDLEGIEKEPTTKKHNSIHLNALEEADHPTTTLTPITELDDEEDIFVPQITFINGKIVVNKDSLIMETQPLSRQQDYNEGIAIRTRTRTPAEKWTPEETEKFFMALRQYGTDFSLIEMLFENRNRKQIKNKFKKEEKMHPKRIDRALNAREAIDIEEYNAMVTKQKSGSIPKETI